jgi:hypothetical protein
VFPARHRSRLGEAGGSGCSSDPEQGRGGAPQGRDKRARDSQNILLTSKASLYHPRSAGRVLEITNDFMNLNESKVGYGPNPDGVFSLVSRKL